MICVTRARETRPSRAISAIDAISPRSSIPWNLCASASSREIRGTRPLGTAARAGASRSTLRLPSRPALKAYRTAAAPPPQTHRPHLPQRDRVAPALRRR